MADKELKAKGCIQAVIHWNTLEPRPRSNDFSRSLRAEVRDPLWMLARQWQWGEFDAEDAGTPVCARLSMINTTINALATGNEPAQGGYSYLVQERPLEAAVERLMLENVAGDVAVRLEMGRQWVNLLLPFGAAFQPAAWYVHPLFRFYPPVLPNNADENTIAKFSLESSDHETADLLASVSGRAVDGWAVYLGCLDNSIQNQRGTIPVAGFNDAVKSFLAWMRRTYSLPDDVKKDAWVKDQLEYRFKMSAAVLGKANVFEAEEYKGGNLDWYHLDFAPAGTTMPAAAAPVPVPNLSEQVIDLVIPAKMAFDGMPNARWWAIESTDVSFGNMEVNTNDLARLLLMDFILNYSDDWYLIPQPVKTGTLVNLEGIEVRDVFGVRTLVSTANATAATATERGWSLFTHEIRPIIGAITPPLPDTRFFLTPTVTGLLESPPVEEVQFFRDEMANLVWGVERTIPDRLFGGREGSTAALKAREMMEALIPPEAVTPPPADNTTEHPKVRFRLATKVPENYIPFLPVQLTPNSTGSSEIKLQRGAMPREVHNRLLAQNVRPRTTLLQGVLPAQTMFIKEEEVPRQGTLVSLTWQRARWHDGNIVVWLGRRKQANRDVKPSGLLFDAVEVMP